MPRPALLLLAALLLPACTGKGAVSTDSGTQRFVSGDGIVHVVDASRRVLGPSLVGTTLDGTSLDVARSGSGPVVVNVWGSWCAPCKAEQPDLERVAEATRSRGVRFVGINVKDSRTGARAHVKKYGVTYPSLFDPSSRLLARFAIAPKTTPSTYVLDADWRIAAYVYGPVTERDLTALIDKVAPA